MRKIHEDCYAVSEEYGKPGSYVIGANIAGFQRVARAMLAFGVI
jgi:glutamate dehydrogenase (NADP+)